MFAQSVTAAVAAAFLITLAIFTGVILPTGLFLRDFIDGRLGFLARATIFSSPALTALFVLKTRVFFASTLYPDGADIVDLLLIAALTAAMVWGAISAHRFFKNHVEPRLARL